MKLLSSKIGSVWPGGECSGTAAVSVEAIFSIEGSNRIRLEVSGHLAGELYAVAHTAYLAAEQAHDPSPETAEAKAIFSYLATL